MWRGMAGGECVGVAREEGAGLEKPIGVRAEVELEGNLVPLPDLSSPLTPNRPSLLTIFSPDLSPLS